MPKDNKDHHSGRFMRWFHETFDDWFFRSMIGPGQVDNAVHGADREAREQWKRDLENRKRYTKEQRERKRLAREAERGT
jgi:signal transduction histidine kinase